MTPQEIALKAHEEWQGKLRIVSRASVSNNEELAIAYTPGVAEPCKVIAKDKDAVFRYTGKGNLVAVVTDGSAVLGLGNIGPEAALPVMEGKAALFQAFGGVDAFPILIDSQDVEEIVRTVALIAPGFGGINLEDISAPRCFEVEKRLKEMLDIPVFHDDQHGTAVVVLAALLNALRITGKTIETVKIIINGAGAAGIAIGQLLRTAGAQTLIYCDKEGAVASDCAFLDQARLALLKGSNPMDEKGSLADVICGADVFIGVSAAGVLKGEMVKTMAKDAIVFAMANPTPEVMPKEALDAGARVVGTGRSDFANQINNVLAFPGIFKGALQVRARDIDHCMKLAAAHAIAGLVSAQELKEDYIIPHAFDPRVGVTVADAVADAARKAGLARA